MGPLSPGAGGFQPLRSIKHPSFACSLILAQTAVQRYVASLPFTPEQTMTATPRYFPAPIPLAVPLRPQGPLPPTPTPEGFIFGGAPRQQLLPVPNVPRGAGPAGGAQAAASGGLCLEVPVVVVLNMLSETVPCSRGLVVGFGWKDFTSEFLLHRLGGHDRVWRCGSFAGNVRFNFFSRTATLCIHTSPPPAQMANRQI